MAVQDYIRQRFFPHLWCAGCGHGIVLNGLIRAVEQLGMSRNEIVMVSGIGCSSRISGYVDFHTLHTIHGRALAFATGVKLSKPELNVIVPMGDGDALAIGGNHFIHAARRNIDLTAIVMNNRIYGMTGGQMAPTTMPGQVTTTSPFGRDTGDTGEPVRVAELLAALKTPAFIARTSSHDAKHSLKLKKIVRRAFELQRDNKCFTFIEVLSTCPTNWGLSPNESSKWLEDVMMPYYPLGILKEPPQ